MSHCQKLKIKQNIILRILVHTQDTSNISAKFVVRVAQVIHVCGTSMLKLFIHKSVKHLFTMLFVDSSSKCLPFSSLTAHLNPVWLSSVCTGNSVRRHTTKKDGNMYISLFKRIHLFHKIYAAIPYWGNMIKWQVYISRLYFRIYVPGNLSKRSLIAHNTMDINSGWFYCRMSIQPVTTRFWYCEIATL